MITASLSGKHALITGGSRGIGLAIAQALLAHEANVTILGRDETSLRAALHALPLEQRQQARPVVADVADNEAVLRAFKEARSFSGNIDILVNNAGQAGSAPFLKINHQLWRRMMTVNLDGTFHCSQAALENMLQSGWGRIINIASTAGLVGYGYVSAYCAAKHGVIGLTRSLALEVATKGITVNAVCPGYTETDMVEQAVETIVAKTKRTQEEARAELAALNPQRRLVRPEEVANAVAWLCLPGSESITGQAIAVAGGEVM